MTIALAVLAIACLAAVVYSYVIYPLILLAVGSVVQLLRDLRFVAGKGERRIAPLQAIPDVAVVIAAFNEERHLRARIENLRSLDYPADRLHVYIGSDGSSDRSVDILREFEDTIHAQVFTQNRGKASVLNDLVNATTQPILVFSDANTHFDRDALRRLVAHFGDPAVGCVSGELRLRGSAGNNQDSLYWRFEQLLKFFEARIGGLLGANGAIYAIRRELWQPLRADTICDDFCVAMNVAASGWRLAYEPGAWAEEDTPAAIGEEFARRVRIGIGNFQALRRHPEYFLRTSMATRFAYVSHKVLRWLAPHLLLIALMASLLLGLRSQVWLVFAILQIGAYAFAAALYMRAGNGATLAPLLRIPAFLFALNLAFLVASWRFVTGCYSGSWRRSER